MDEGSNEVLGHIRSTMNHHKIEMIGFSQGERKKFYENEVNYGRIEVRFGRPIGYGSDGKHD